MLTAAGAGLTGSLAVATGCDWWDRPPPPPPPDPLEPLLSATRALRARYRHTIAVHPDVAERLQPLLQTHDAHVTALRDMIGRPELATPTPTTSATPSPPAVPAGSDEAVAALREAEERARDDARHACLQASAERAGLLGSICAARATHVEVLA